MLINISVISLLQNERKSRNPPGIVKLYSEPSGSRRRSSSSSPFRDKDKIKAIIQNWKVQRNQKEDPKSEERANSAEERSLSQDENEKEAGEISGKDEDKDNEKEEEKDEEEKKSESEESEDEKKKKPEPELDFDKPREKVKVLINDK